MTSQFRQGVPLAKKNRICPLIFLIDVSTSMGHRDNGCPINAVNEAIDDLLPQLIDVAKNDIVLKIAFMQFYDLAEWMVRGDNEEDILMSPSVFKDFVWKPMPTGGVTNLKAALKALKKLFNSSVFQNNKFVSPIIVLITDGYPTNRSGEPDIAGYVKELNILSTDKFFRSAIRVAIGYGNSVDKEVLEKFAGTKGNVLMGADSQQLKTYIRFVTMKATQSSIACSPFCIGNTVIID